MAENIKPSMPKTESAKEFMLKIMGYVKLDIVDMSIIGTLTSELLLSNSS